MADGTSLINIGELAKPVTTLIEKISDACGGYFKPYQIKRVAKAEAEAELIRKKAHIENSELQDRALRRFVSEEIRKQHNIENIANKALRQVQETASPENIEDDWIVNFFDKCRLISDEEMQSLWAKVLAGEANTPGSFSKRTVNFMESLDKSDAELFSSICSFAWRLPDGPALIILDFNASIYNDNNIKYNKLLHLDDIGLINFDSGDATYLTSQPKRINVSYYGSVMNIEFQKPEGNYLEVGKAVFSNVGEQLHHVCDSKGIREFEDYVIRKWSDDGCILSSTISKQ